MKSLVAPLKSFGDKFARSLYIKISKKLKIDPVNEGRLLENKIQKIFLDFENLATQEGRNLAEAKANTLVDRYINRSKKFWETYQLYAFNRGQTRATKDLSPWLEQSKKAIDSLKEDEERILN